MVTKVRNTVQGSGGMTQGLRTASAVGREEARALFSCLAQADGVLLAISGGADSTALLVLAAEWAGDAGARLVAATVDHGLRPEGQGEAAAVAAMARQIGVEHVTLCWRGPKPRVGIEQAAREARYGLLVELARERGLSHLVTAHTLDDQAETVLMRLAAGSGLSGLAAMRPAVSRDGVVHARPLLGIAKARLIATLQERGVVWSEDAMNADLAFARPRLRAARSVLEREGLTGERMMRLSQRMARADKALDWAADAAWRQFATRSADLVHLRGEGLGELPAEIALRLLLRALDISGDGTVRRLARAESLSEAAFAAVRECCPLVRTLAGARICVRNGVISAAPAPPRRTRRLQTMA